MCSGYPYKAASLLCNLIIFLDPFKAIAGGLFGLIDAPLENRLIELACGLEAAP
jgi:hypothetical protein